MKTLLLWLLAAGPAFADTPADTVGKPPASPVAKPAFDKVLGFDGEPRSPDQLLGKPTVIWFYPAAMTPG